MNFYHAYYKRQYYDKDEKLWKDTCYNRQGIVVIADNYGEAKSKVETYSTKLQNAKQNALDKIVLEGVDFETAIAELNNIG